MKTTPKTIRFILIITLGLIAYHSYAEAEMLITSPPGDVITIEEASRFRLFSNCAGFQKASLIAVNEKVICLKLYSFLDEKEVVEEIPFSSDLIDVINGWLEGEIYKESGVGDDLKYVCKITTKELAVTGELISWTGLGIKIKVEFTDLEIPLDKITSIKHKDTRVFEEKFGFAKDPNQTRLFFAPTGRSLKAGEGYFSVYEVVFPDVNYAILDNISIGGGIFPFSTSEYQLFWFTPKIGLIQKEKFALSTGLLHFQIHDEIDPNEEDTDGETSDPMESFGIAYGVGTYGNRDYAVTLGVGFAYGDDAGNRPAIMLGGEYRLTESTKLISENWIIPNMDDPFGLIGIRWFGKKMAVDFALGRTSGMDIIAFPWVDFVINF